MKRTCFILLLLILFCLSALTGCSDQASYQPVEELDPTVPELLPGSEATWAPEQTQGFEGGPEPGIPGIRHTVPDTEFLIDTIPASVSEETAPILTEPPVTELPQTEPILTEPPVTEPMLTEPTTTEPPTEEPVTESFEAPTEPTASTEPVVYPTDPEDWRFDSEEDMTEPAGPGVTEPPETEAPDTGEPPLPELSPLEPVLAERLEGLPGKWSLYAKNLDTGETICVNDEPMVAASLIKLFVAGAYYETDPTASDRTFCELADVMINISSNDACNRLITLLGMEEINDFIRREGFTASELNRKMLEQSDQENYTSARECGEVLEAVVNGTYISPEASARLLQNLKDQERTGKIPAGVPSGVETANKTGELKDTENDACIVWSDGGIYILCIMATDLTDVYAARTEIVSVSALVYTYFTTGELP